MPNCYFEVDYFESIWNFSRPFDFIDGRGLESPIKHLARFLGQAMENLRPGGWLQLADMAPEAFADDDTLKNAPYCVEWGKLIDEASIKLGKRLNVPHLYKEWMINAGFKNVKEGVDKVCSDPLPQSFKPLICRSIRSRSAPGPKIPN